MKRTVFVGAMWSASIACAVSIIMLTQEPSSLMPGR